MDNMDIAIIFLSFMNINAANQLDCSNRNNVASKLNP